MEGVLLLYETVDELHSRKKPRVLLKIDFEKAYDKVKWSFLYQILQAKGFGDKWCDWMMKMVSAGDDPQVQGIYRSPFDK